MYEIFSELLQKYGVTPYKVSKETGISQSSLSDWKKGKITPKTDSLQKIASYFGVTLDYLTSGEKEPEKKETTLTPKDERDITNEIIKVMQKLSDKESGPVCFDGEELTDEDKELFSAQLEIMLRHLKKENKVKYNPGKNKK